MAVQYTPLIFLLLLSAGAASALGLYAWQHRHRHRGVVSFALLMFAATWWALGQALQWASANFAAQYFWLRFTWGAHAVLPVLWLLFAAQYTGRRSLDRQRVALLCVIPAVTVLMAWTNVWHRWVWSDVHTVLVSTSTATLEVTYSGWFFVHLAYSYLLMFIGTALILGALLRSPDRYRGQAPGLIVGVLTPWAVNVLYQVGLIPLSYLDPTPLAFAVSGAAFAWSIFRYRMLNIVPLAHEAVIRTLRDPVIVLDEHQQVVDINPAAARLLQRPVAELLGEPRQCSLVLLARRRGSPRQRRR